MKRSKIGGLGKEANRIGDARVLGHPFVGGRAKTYVDWEARLLGVGRAEARRLELPWDFVMRSKRRLRSGAKLRTDAAGRARRAVGGLQVPYHAAPSKERRPASLYYRRPRSRLTAF